MDEQEGVGPPSDTWTLTIVHGASGVFSVMAKYTITDKTFYSRVNFEPLRIKHAVLRTTAYVSVSVGLI